MSTGAKNPRAKAEEKPGQRAALMTVVAVGPGDPRLLTLRGREVLEGADVVVGFKTVLDVVMPWLGKADVRPMAYRDQDAVLDYAAQQAINGKRTVVCAWGDLNVSAKELVNRVRQRAERVDLVPCISSVQIACMRAGISLEEAIFITLHRREDAAGPLEELVHYLKEDRRHIILIPRPFDLMPATICRQLLEAGLPPERRVTVYQRLSLEGEKAWSGDFSALATQFEDKDFSDLSIMVFFR
ncbi:MAG: precorrin-6y C5,15-methyltransferase (decarboxylating) subunit CbiE [Dehalococcoidia bacterium]|nr:precorrin-6y C5,15-methyltransferase (decarboxylating) subunit CbiE [Dehalococcoidia bacterium]MSQ17364.1 precorrin-6y C5,15-methyltransferase (decarboxylating) subunit CbiE [Dehalococcoidia bacterium]